MPLTFAPGSTEGVELCASLTAYSDNLVESEEMFSVRLLLPFSKESFFGLGNTEAAIYVIDSDGMLPKHMSCLEYIYIFQQIFFTHAAATFDLPTMATITEINSTFFVCATMTTTPSGSTLAMEVSLSLSTVDGTGILLNNNTWPYWWGYYIPCKATPPILISQC